MTSANEHLPSPPKPRLSPLEFRNTDLVSRLLAATPPYLYNMSLLPNTYFFSEMLRSFVQAKAERSATFQPPIRRSRKRNWSHSRSDYYVKPPTEQKPEENQQQESIWISKNSEKLEENPLELTMDKGELNYQDKVESFPKLEPTSTEVFQHNIPPNNNLVLPPPPPIWYPPIYHTPPYGIDPLHFFIDLKVSGHIYDKKTPKEHTTIYPRETSPKEESSTFPSTFKQTTNCSAFSVPVPSENIHNSNHTETKSKRFDVKSMGFDKSQNKTSTNYVMSNISNIYKGIYQSKETPAEPVTEKVENETEEEKKVKDLRALIGLELVVDYMKHKPEKNNEESSASSDIESVGSSTLEVVDEN